MNDRKKKICSIVTVAISSLLFTVGCAPNATTQKFEVGVTMNGNAGEITLQTGGKGKNDAYNDKTVETDYLRDPNKDALYERYSFPILGESTMPIGTYIPGRNKNLGIAYAQMKENGINYVLGGERSYCEDYQMVYLSKFNGDYQTADLLYNAYKEDFESKAFGGLYQDEPGIETIYHLAHYKEFIYEITNNQCTLLACPLPWEISGSMAAFGWVDTSWAHFIETFESFKIDGHDRLNAVTMKWFDDYFGYELDRTDRLGYNQLKDGVYGAFFEEVYQPDYVTGNVYSANAPYPYMTTGGIMEKAKYTKDSGVPYMAYILMTGHEQRQERVVSREELFLEINVALAYGAKGILYFTYGAAGTDETGWWGTAVTTDGTLNENYYNSQEMNAYIKAMEEILMFSTFEGVITTGWSTWKDKTQEMGLDLQTFGKVSGVKGAHNLIGCFNYDTQKDGTFNGTAYYVTNTSITGSEITKLSFAETVNCYFIHHGKKMEYRGVDSVVIELGAGEGGLLVIEE